jgi:hypothetical protein
VGGGVDRYQSHRSKGNQVGKLVRDQSLHGGLIVHECGSTQLCTSFTYLEICEGQGQIIFALRLIESEDAVHDKWSQRIKEKDIVS